MSILSSLYHGEIHDKPNDVHNVPEHAGAAQNGAKQAVPDESWMSVPFGDAADASASDAQIADAHAVAASYAFEHGGAGIPADKPHPAQNGSSQDDAANSAGGNADGNAALPAHAERRMRALRDGNLRPPLYYTQQEQTPCASGVWESPHTVASKLESKEEYPQG